jgi:hypothetical protein
MFYRASRIAGYVVLQALVTEGDPTGCSWYTIVMGNFMVGSKQYCASVANTAHYKVP